MPKEKTKKIENIPKEISDYPKTDYILYTDGRRSYHYNVKQEGLYLQPPVLAYTQGKNKYKFLTITVLKQHGIVKKTKKL